MILLKSGSIFILIVSSSLNDPVRVMPHTAEVRGRRAKNITSSGDSTLRFETMQHIFITDAGLDLAVDCGLAPPRLSAVGAGGRTGRSREGRKTESSRNV